MTETKNNRNDFNREREDQSEEESHGQRSAGSASQAWRPVQHHSWHDDL